MKLLPCFNRVIIQDIPRSPKLKIIIPDSSEPAELLQLYLVLAIGPDVTCCEAGDKILLRPDVNILGIQPPPKAIGIIDASAIIAIDSKHGVELIS